MQIIQKEDICSKAGEKGDYALKLFSDLKYQFPEKIKEVRGLGLMLGIEFQDSAKDVWRELLNRGYICNLTQEKILRLLPPLIIEKSDIDDFCCTLENILHESKMSG